jgi:hypothetical protein
MKLVRTFSMIIALAGATTAFADTKPADKKAPEAKPEAKKDAPPAPPAQEISAAEAEKVLAFFKQFSAAIIANKDSCPKMAVAINGVIDKNKDFIAKANAMKAEGKKLPKATEEKMGEEMKAMIPAVMKCKDDKDVNAAMQRMEKGGDKAPAAKSEPKTAPAAPAAPAPKK